MPLQAALTFIRQVRMDTVHQARLKELSSPADMDAVVEYGAAMGLTFTAEELQSAFRYDWKMRWLQLHQYQ